MSIYEMTNTDVLQRCAKCSALNRIPLVSIEVGTPREEQLDVRVVALPACPTCRSAEILIRSPDDEQAHPSPGSFGHLHRMLVDQVHAELVKRKRVVACLKDGFGRVDPAIAHPPSNDDIQRWFSKGFRIELPVGELTVAPVTAKETAP